MSLVDLSEAVEESYSDFDDSLIVDLDAETKNELAMLMTALDTDDEDELVRRAVHALFQTTVDTGRLDFQLRRQYDVTYDEYLSGMTFEAMTGNGYEHQSMDEDRRYQF